MAKLLLENGADVHAGAAEAGHLPMVEFLVAKWHADVFGNEGAALVRATAFDRWPVVEFLLDKIPDQ
jgi:hypothetical protein